MDIGDRLRIERDALEGRLLQLERAVEAERLRLIAQGSPVDPKAADLATSVEALLARLGQVNAQLAEMRRSALLSEPSFDLSRLPMPRAND